jgi:hypothetical protein
MIWVARSRSRVSDAGAGLSVKRYLVFHHEVTKISKGNEKKRGIGH